MTDFRTFSDTATNKIPTLSYIWSLRNVYPFLAEPPCIGHDRSYHVLPLPCITSFGNCTRPRATPRSRSRQPLEASTEIRDFTECQDFISSTNAKSFTVLCYVREKKEPHTVPIEQYLKNNSQRWTRSSLSRSHSPTTSPAAGHMTAFAATACESINFSSLKVGSWSPFLSAHWLIGVTSVIFPRSR